MKIWWFSLIFMLSFVLHVPINGDTYHYQVIRKICPTGTYHDPIKDKCRKVPGGGEMIKINLDARCSAGFLGLLAHSKKSRYYYVCKRDGVLTCMCKPTENFNRIKLKCDDKSHKKEGLAHEVVDHIVDKYKCAVMNGEYGTTIYPQVTTQPMVDVDNDKITRLQNILRYLTFIRTINDRPQIFESVETTPIPITQSPIQPRTIIISLEDPSTTESILRATGPPEDPRNIEIDIENFKRNWDPTTPATTILTAKPVNPRISPRVIKTTTERFRPTTGVTSRVSDDTTTVLSTITESTTLAATESTIDTTTVTQEITTENDLTTNESDALAQNVETTTQASEEGPHGRLVSRIVPRTTTEGIDGKTNPDDDDDEYEEYFEYFYEHEPDKVIRTSNATKKKVTGRKFDDDDDWKEVKTFTETIILRDETTDPNEENPAETSTLGITEETTIVETTEATLDTTTDITDTTTENDENPTTTELMKDDPTTTEIPTTTSMETTTKLEESTSDLPPPEPLIRKFPGDLNFNDFQSVDAKFLEKKLETSTMSIDSTTKFDESTTDVTLSTIITLPTTTLAFEGITPPSTRMYKYTTTINPETTTTFYSTTTEETTEAANDDQTTTENAKGRNFDDNLDFLTNEQITTENEGTTTTEMSTIQIESTTLEFDNLDQKSFTTEIPSTTQISTSTLQDLTTEIETSTVEKDATTSEAPVLDTTDTTTVLTTSTTDITTLSSESSTILDSKTTAIPRSIKTRANTEATTTDRSEPTTTITSKPKKLKKIKDEVEKKLETELKLPQISSLTLNKEEPEKKERDDYEYYYTYEEYLVDKDGKEIKDKKNIKDENIVKKMKKTPRDNSNEYYAESISASHEHRKSNNY